MRSILLKALRAEGVEAVLWQTKPVPGQTLFRRKIGYGKGCPWDHAAPVDYDLAQFPKTARLLDEFILLFSQTFPIACQSVELCDAYAAAFIDVWSRLPALVAKASSLVRRAQKSAKGSRNDADARGRRALGAAEARTGTRARQ